MTVGTTNRAGGPRRASPSKRGRQGTAGTVDPATDDARLLQLYDAMMDLRDGHLQRRLDLGGEDVVDALGSVFNEIADRQEHVAAELNRVRRVAGRDGRHAERLDPGPLRAPGPTASRPATTWSPT